ncbi:hypothetical protein ACFXG4_05020 [Nocardia sp. NPDC059246]|uniref:Gp37-like protein n=1 Tax=unclassified Nocardia TaxID=2637762 RepID=UPI0036C8AFB1
MTATTTTIDFDAEFAKIRERLEREDERRVTRPTIRLWDGDWNYRGDVWREISAKFQLLENETGIGTIELPATYYLARWLTDHKNRPTANVHITVDHLGTRWSGFLDEVELDKDDDGQRVVRATFKHDFEHLKHILVYCNPFACPPAFG